MSAPFVQLGATRDPPGPDDDTVDQIRVMEIPELYDLALEGTRGGGKSEVLAKIIARHSVMYGDGARCLFVRLTHAAVEDFRATLLRILRSIWGTQVRFNANEGHVRLPNGAFIELAQLAEEAHYAKYQGRSFGLIVADELTQHPNFRLVDLLRSNLRGPKHVPCRYIFAANPGGPSHAEFRKRFIDPAQPWVPFLETISGREFVRCRMDFRNNHHIDREEYERQLRASCAGDEELLKGWLSGDWSIAKGSFFGSVLDERRSAFSMTPEELKAATTYADDIPSIVRLRLPELDTRLYLAHDFGVSAPSVTFLCCRSPGFEGPDGRCFPRDSLLLLDELATNAPDSLTEGMGYTVPCLAEQIVELSKEWGMKRAAGVADDACFARGGHAAGSIAEEFRRHRVYFRPARKAQRVPGWARLRSLMEAAGDLDRPGFYASRRCEYLWETAPSIGRDPRRVDDVDSRGPDHACDAARYALSGSGGGGSIRPLML